MMKRRDFLKKLSLVPVAVATAPSLPELAEPTPFKKQQLKLLELVRDNPNLGWLLPSQPYLPNVVWGINPLTGFPVSITPGELHPEKMNILFNALLPSDPTQEWYFSQDGGEYWERVEKLTEEVIAQTQVMIG